MRLLVWLLFIVSAGIALGESPKSSVDEKAPHAPGLTPEAQLKAIAAQGGKLRPRSSTDYNGIPPIRYKGSLCAPSVSRVYGPDLGGVSVRFSCNDHSFSPERMCSISWNSGRNRLYFGVSTHRFSTHEGWSRHESSHFDIVDDLEVTMSDLPSVATKLMAEKCAGPLATPREYRTETRSFAVRAGLSCSTTRQSSAPDFIPRDISVRCYAANGPVSVICTAEKPIPRGGSEKTRDVITFNRSRFTDFANRGGNHTEYTEPEIRPPDRGLGFDEQVRRWMSQNCRL